MATTSIVLTVGDTLNVTAQAAPIPNKLPMVSAGTDQTIKLPVSEVTLKGTVSDSDGTIVSQQWTKTVGGAGAIVSPTALTTKVTGLVAGTYQFRLMATDDKGGKTADDIIVTVLPADVVTPPTKIDYLNLPVSGPLDLSGKSNIVVENKKFSYSTGVTIKLYSGANNIIIRNCYFEGSAQEIIELENAYNITIENCLMKKGFSGVYAVGSQNVKIRNCQFLNMRIRYVNGGFAGRGTFVQFNSCSGGELIDCKGENFAGESDPEDMVSCYNSSNIVIRNNIFRGGGPSTSGGGIIMGDNGGNNCVAELNTLMNPGQYGMAIAGGTNMKILNNKIWSDQKPWSNNPLYAWAQGNQVGVSANATVTGNKGKWIDKNGGVNNGWDGGRNISNLVFEYLTPIALAEMGVPAHLIDFVTPEQLLTIRK